ncbi:MAG TPA: decaprenyl-phosphate phosphoribosyltransferase [Solirubrobacteraceae bacterium]|nr:decaprenyl-phosphate phosphoribosyltransferase [Solirubrobacteraceae bacterium]
MSAAAQATRSEPDSPPVATTRPHGARALSRACRPRQWSKNGLLLAAPLAGGVLDQAHVALAAAGAIVAFCMLSSATYLLNDVRDVESDRLHHRKRLRPIAAGDLSIRAALAAALVLAVGGLVLAAVIRPQFALVGLGYLALTAAYSLWLRHVIVADILAIAAGFVLRAAAGAAATDVAPSRWFLVVTSCAAIFVVAGKRHAELFGSARDGLTRATLRRYSERALLVLLAAAAAGTVAAYAVWAFRRPEDGPWYEATIIPVVLWLGRYGSLVARGAGEAPEDLILADRALLGLTVTWIALFLGGMYAGR